MKKKIEGRVKKIEVRGHSSRRVFAVAKESPKSLYYRVQGAIEETHGPVIDTLLDEAELLDLIETALTAMGSKYKILRRM